MTSILNRLQTYILPKEVDFFNNLVDHAALVESVVDTMHDVYVSGVGRAEALQIAFDAAETLRQNNLFELHNVLITPIDKEAISRAYLHLDWVILSIKHLDLEVRAYGITRLKEYESIFSILREQTRKSTHCFRQLKEKRYESVLNEAKEIIALDDALIADYSKRLSGLFQGEVSMHVIKHKEILSQLKEVSKRIRICTNLIEDFVFKMN